MAPRFSIVSAVYEVEAYLGDFIASIEAQDFPLERVEVIMVDDGSTDGSAAILAQWQRRRPELVTVLTQPNGGQGAARNLGIRQARGEWVTMPDPDDMLAPDYLRRVDDFLRRNPTTEMVATNRVFLYEATGKKKPHMLARHFEGPDRLRDLDREPTFFHGSAPAAFFPTATVQQAQLRFDDRIRPNFEDGHFCSMYLLGRPAPLVGFVGSAEYVYRKRADSSSTLNTSSADPRRFLDVPRFGYLAVLQRGAQRPGGIPHWLQNFVLYETFWYWADDENPAISSAVARGEVAEEFHRLMAQIVGLLDEDVIRTYNIRKVKPIWRDIMLHGYDPRPWHAPAVMIDKVDLRQRTVRLTYHFTGELPEETFDVDGVRVEPLHAKVRATRYLDRVLVRERIVWLPYGAVSARLGGAQAEVRIASDGNPWVLDGWRARDRLNPDRIVRSAQAPRPLTRRHRRFLQLARSRPVRALYRHSWVLMDRIQDADDSAEHLFVHLRRRHRRINAWFVVAPGTDAYRRLHRRYPRRVVAHGSLRWRLLMLNCEQLISTHADAPITAPPAITRFGPPNWRFVFLQHGVTKDDISDWLNPKDADVFVVSTPAEYAAIAGDDTAYRYTSREVVLTGLPRFDLVRAAGEKYPPAQRDLILFAPTWRNWLVSRVGGSSTVQWRTNGAFRESDFARNWSALMSSPELAELARTQGLSVAVLMHPNLQPFVDELELPEHVTLHTFDDDVRALFARSRVTITDYSSMAFNAAYIDRPIAYFQFDQDRVLHGGHIGRAGYFDYERDGFGPVTQTVDAAVTAVEQAIMHGPDPQPKYARRIDEAFPVRDGGCRERVTQAILDGAKRVPFESGPAPTSPATRRFWRRASI